MKLPEKRLRACRLICAFLMALSPLLSAQGVISVGSNGAGPFPFDNYSTATNGWSTAYRAGDSRSIDTAAEMDAAAQIVDIATITNGLAATSTSLGGSRAEWHSAGFIQTRCQSGTSAILLLAALQNDSASEQHCALLKYDFGLSFPTSPSSVETVPGYRVFYSFSGKPGEWQLIPDLSSVSNSSTLTTEIEFNAPWDAGSPLYLLWADDNGPGDSDGAHTIDNLILQWCDQPIEIARQPQSITVVEDNNASISVVISNLAPVRYQWFKDGMILPGKTNLL
jgi:hypothetical protein